MSHLVVRRPGARSTVEDLGRSGFGHVGVPAGGAFDALALVAANRLVGNRDGDAGIEVTLVGPELELHGTGELAVSIVGADFGARAIGADGGCDLRPGAIAILAPGDRLRLGAARDGARAWIALAGGIDVPVVLGSRSTCVSGGFGGLDGRALRAGDRLELHERHERTAGPRPPIASDSPFGSRRSEVTLLHVLPGPQIDRFPRDPISSLENCLWQVSADSNRAGVRVAALDPRTARSLAESTLEGIAPEGTTLGAIQVTPDGGAVILGPDRPVTGGYAKPALVAEADIGAVAALRPGDRVRFARISLQEALERARARRSSLPSGPPTP